MRRILKLSLTCLAAGAVTACDPDTVVETGFIPTAGVRFINAVPDTAAMDFRFVDMVESNPHWAIAFRNNVVTTSGVPASTLIQYKGARAGTRIFKIFMNGGCTESACNQSYASTVVVTDTVELVAGRNYTAILWGYSNPTRTGAGASLPAGAPAMRLDFFEEAVTVDTPQVKLRVANATAATIDVEVYASTGAETNTLTWPDVAPLTFSDHLPFAEGQYLYDVEDGTTNADLIATDGRALIGADAVTEAPGPFEAIPGTTVGGSAVTGIVFPRSVTGSPAASSTSTSISFMWDRRPPRPSGI